MLDGQQNSCQGRTQFASICERLEDTCTEIAGTVAHLSRLQERKRRILVERNVCVSPVLRLPTELLCEIFLWCIPLSRTLPGTRDAPLLLTHVCSHWRVAAIGFQQLWASISIAGVVPAFPKPGVVALIELWIERAGTCSLDVFIVMEDGEYPSLFPRRVMTGGYSSVFHQFRRDTSHRWRELDVVCRVNELPVLLHNEDPWRLPELRKLKLLFVHSDQHLDGVAFNPNILSDLRDLPALREVHFMSLAPSNLRLPWAQLTTVRAENLIPADVLRMVATTPRLVHAAFTLRSTQYPHAPFHVGNPLLSCLVSLDVCGELCTPLLDRIEAPFLTYLKIAFGSKNDLLSLALFLTRCPALTEVELDTMVLYSDTLFLCLEAIPNVSTLRLGVVTGLMNGLLLDLLHRNLTLLPALKKLVLRERIDRYNEPPLDEAVVVAMLRARSMGRAGSGVGGAFTGSTLVSFSLFTSHIFVPARLHPQFFVLAEEGMHIELRSLETGPFARVYYDSSTAAI